MEHLEERMKQHPDHSKFTTFISRYYQFRLKFENSPYNDFFFLMNQHSSTNLINEQGYDNQRKK